MTTIIINSDIETNTTFYSNNTYIINNYVNVINNSIRLKPAAVWKERFAVRKDALAGVFIRFGL